MFLKRIVTVMLAFSLFVFGGITFAQSTGDVGTETDVGTGDVDMDNGDEDATCELSTKDNAMVDRFTRKLTVFYTRWPDRATKWKTRLDHLLEKLPMGERARCMMNELAMHLDDLKENGVSEDEEESPVMQGWRKKVKDMLSRRKNKTN